MKTAPKTLQRINFSLAPRAVAVLCRVAAKGNRSRFVEEAVLEKAARMTRENLRKSLAEGYAARSARDLRMVEEWFGIIDEEAWEPAARARRARK